MGDKSRISCCRDGYELCDQEIADDASEYLFNMFNTTEKSYTFVYYGNIDGLGHTYEWCLTEYNAGIDVVDAQVKIPFTILFSY